MSKTRLIGLFAFGLAAGCDGYGGGYGGSYGGSAGTPGGPPPANVVVIEATDGLAFSPAQLTVTAGTTVRWVNRGSVPHTVTSGASSTAADSPGAVFDSGLGGGAFFEHTFTTVGDQPFFCRFHEAMGMRGVVTVAAASNATYGGPPTPTN